MKADDPATRAAIRLAKRQTKKARIMAKRKRDRNEWKKRRWEQHQ